MTPLPKLSNALPLQRTPYEKRLR